MSLCCRDNEEIKIDRYNQKVLLWPQQSNPIQHMLQFMPFRIFDCEIKHQSCKRFNSKLLVAAKERIKEKVNFGEISLFALSFCCTE